MFKIIKAEMKTKIEDNTIMTNEHIFAAVVIQ